jgi:hypothetical protein
LSSAKGSCSSITCSSTLCRWTGSKQAWRSRGALDLADPQQGAEPDQQRVGLVERLVDHLAIAAFQPRLLADAIEQGPEAIERRAQVVGDVVADTLDLPEQALGLVHHGVGQAGQHVDLVAPMRDGQPHAQLALQGCAAGGPQVVDAAQRGQAEQGGGGQAQKQDRRSTDRQGVDDDLAQSAQHLGVVGDQQDLARRQAFDQGAGARLEAFLLQVVRRGVEDRVGRQVADVAGQRGAVGREQAVERHRPAIGGDQRVHPLRQPLGIAAGQDPGLGHDDGVQLARHVAGRAPIDHAQQRHDRHREDRAVQQGQPERRRAPQFVDAALHDGALIA